MIGVPPGFPMCAHCGEQPASCLGCYEDHNREDCPHEGCAQHDDDCACDECCGHGNEDGHCYSLVDLPGVVQTLDLNLRLTIAECDRLRALLLEVLETPSARMSDPVELENLGRYVKRCAEIKRQLIADGHVEDEQN